MAVAGDEAEARRVGACRPRAACRPERVCSTPVEFCTALLSCRVQTCGWPSGRVRCVHAGSVTHTALASLASLPIVGRTAASAEASTPATAHAVHVSCVGDSADCSGGTPHTWQSYVLRYTAQK